MERAETIPDEETVPASRTGLKLALGAGACLFAAGGLLWWREGADVFTHLVTAAFALCF